MVRAAGDGTGRRGWYGPQGLVRAAGEAGLPSGIETPSLGVVDRGRQALDPAGRRRADDLIVNRATPRGGSPVLGTVRHSSSMSVGLQPTGWVNRC